MQKTDQQRESIPSFYNVLLHMSLTDFQFLTQQIHHPVICFTNPSPSKLIGEKMYWFYYPNYNTYFYIFHPTIITVTCQELRL